MTSPPRPRRVTAALAMSKDVARLQFPPERLERLRELCDVPDDTPLTNLREPPATTLLADAEILISSWGCPPIDEAVLSASPSLGLVTHAAGSIKRHITEASWERGVRVTSAASALAIPVAEYTLAMILLANKDVFGLQHSFRACRGDLSATRAERSAAAPLTSAGNYGAVVGIVGASHVGRRVIEHLQRFDLTVLVADPYLDDDTAKTLGAQLVDLDELVASSNTVSLHAPILPETRHLIDRRRLGLMRTGATLINTARGWLVDHDALMDELASGRLWAVLDTTEPEPFPADSPFHDVPNAFVTPHIAGALHKETERMADLVLDEIARYVAGEPLAYEVRQADLARIA